MTGIYMPVTRLWGPLSWTNWDSANSQPDGGSVGVLDPGNAFRWRDENTYCGFSCSVQFPALCYGKMNFRDNTITTTVDITTTQETTTIPETTTEITTITTTPDTTTSAQETTSIDFTTTQTLGITTTVTSPAPVNTGCQCKCKDLPASILNSTEAFAAFLEEKIKEIQRSLTVNKKTISANIRKLTSATDSRTSATQVGSIGIAFLSVVLIGIVIPDLITLMQFLKRLKR
ncbi:hypothetical protein KUTeg_001034 [Tegillarca granosa]|uniref:Uncharacterized protein n=1 Tax=Tegillarca granosa TaxID=220873 RepID=A0ABQ9FVZ4_TEGGR|nr:hypothetical protein KUTeg_001034 [Tegillarca granosa]